MKFKCPKIKLVKALNTIVGITTNKDYPILENVKISVSKDKRILLQATDLKISLTYAIEADDLEIIKEGNILLSAQKLFNLIKATPENDISISQDNLDGIINCKDGKFTIKGEEVEKFPDIQKFEEENYVTVDGENFQKLIKKTIFVPTTEKTRYDLNNVLINIEDEKICFVATDGKRLALSEKKFQEKTLESGKSLTVPARGLQQIDRVISATAPKTVQISILENQLLFQTTEVILSTRLSDGKFPPYEKVIPKDLPYKAKVMKKDLLSGLKRVCLLADEKNKIVELLFEKNILKLYTASKSAGTASLEIPLKYEDEPFNIKFNPDFFMDVLKIFDSEEIEMLVKDGKSAILICEEDFKYVALPIKIEETE